MGATKENMLTVYYQDGCGSGMRMSERRGLIKGGSERRRIEMVWMFPDRRLWIVGCKEAEVGNSRNDTVEQRTSSELVWS